MVAGISFRLFTGALIDITNVNLPGLLQLQLCPTDTMLKPILMHNYLHRINPFNLAIIRPLARRNNLSGIFYTYS
jgi:hypothetical protein